jgi:hypothetical protein
VRTPESPCATHLTSRSLARTLLKLRTFLPLPPAQY